MSSILNEKNIIDAINNNTPIFIPDYETEVDKLITWKDALRQFKINLEKPDSGKNNQFHTTKGYAHFMDSNNFYLDHVHLIELKVKHLAKKIQSVHPKKRITTATTIGTLDKTERDIYFNEMNKIMKDYYIDINPLASKAHHEPSLHSDETDNLYLQCYGEVTWTVNNIDYRIKPGQAIFVPAYTEHIVKFNIIPRMALIMNFLSDNVDAPSLPKFDEQTGKTYYEYNKNN
jgi:mannose-6-phosphate isomerase-like protein (cupin superfamily)